MGLGNFRISWWDKAQLALGAALELVGILPREVCRWCSTRLGGGDSYCRVCGTRRGNTIRADGESVCWMCHMANGRHHAKCKRGEERDA